MPRSPASFRLGQRRLAPRALRDLLGSYPTGVAIVTTRAADGRNVGLTIPSFARCRWIRRWCCGAR